MNRLQIRLANYTDRDDCAALVRLMDEYARDEMGGGAALPPTVLAELPTMLARMPHAFTVLAFVDDQAVGLMNCFESLSTFKAQPLINIHDLAVSAVARGQGVGSAMLEWLEAMARRRGCCKLTLEVLQGNRGAQSIYERQGFAAYTLDARHGPAQFWQKHLVPLEA